eukprot:s2068_g8.t1
MERPSGSKLCSIGTAVRRKAFVMPRRSWTAGWQVQVAIRIVTAVPKEKTAKHTRHLLLAARLTFFFSHGVLIIVASVALGWQAAAFRLSFVAVAFRYVYEVVCKFHDRTLKSFSVEQMTTSWWLIFIPAWLGDFLSLLLVVLSWFGSCPYIHLCLQERQARLGDANPSILTEILPDIFFGVLSLIYILLALVAEILLCRHLQHVWHSGEPMETPTACAVFLILVSLLTYSQIIPAFVGCAADLCLSA